MTARLQATTVEPTKKAENDGLTADGGRLGPENGISARFCAFRL